MDLQRNYIANRQRMNFDDKMNGWMGPSFRNYFRGSYANPASLEAGALPAYNMMTGKLEN